MRCIIDSGNNISSSSSSFFLSCKQSASCYLADAAANLATHYYCKALATRQQQPEKMRLSVCLFFAAVSLSSDDTVDTGWQKKTARKENESEKRNYDDDGDEDNDEHDCIRSNVFSN